MQFSIQPTLENDRVILQPLREEDFETLFQAASDPKIWEQHPNKDRWQRDVFRRYFDGAMQSGGAFKIMDKASGEVIGSTRFYDYNHEQNSILIGYTFYARNYWGKGINPGVKKLMLDYILQFVGDVYFHVGAGNTRSQIAISRLGAEKIGEREVAYHGDQAPRLNFLYQISKEHWRKIGASI